MPAEAACLYNKKMDIFSPVEIQKDIFLCLSGMGCESASIAARKCLDIEVNGLISWGVAGALNPALNSGDLVLAETIIDSDKTYQTSSDWLSKLVENLQETDITLINNRIVSNKEVCASVEDKNNLFKKTGAIAVDMESTAIAEVAKNNELDFLVIRAIADEADTSIPDAVLKHTDNLGNPEIFKFLTSCMTKPMQINEIAVLAKSYKKALKTLSTIALELKKQHFFHV
jgi:adenosylhomocysteine nucleosidase